MTNNTICPYLGGIHDSGPCTNFSKFYSSLPLAYSRTRPSCAVANDNHNTPKLDLPDYEDLDWKKKSRPSTSNCQPPGPRSQVRQDRSAQTEARAARQKPELHARSQSYTPEARAARQKPELHARSQSCTPEDRAARQNPELHARSQSCKPEARVAHQKPKLHARSQSCMPEARAARQKTESYTTCQGLKTKPSILLCIATGNQDTREHPCTCKNYYYNVTRQQRVPPRRHVYHARRS